MFDSIKSYLILLGVIGLAAAGTASAFGAEGHVKSEAINCSLCHTCPTPTKENPCLIVCPRPAQEATAADAEIANVSDHVPDVVILKELEKLYVPVRFNHTAHAQMANMEASVRCTVCHHNQPEGQRFLSCKECHPKEIIHEDLSQPGLKGAYHRQCLGCHSEWDKETSCETCHEKSAAGDLHGTATTFNIHKVLQPVPMNEMITFETESEKVPFHHKRHADLYTKDCATCHQQQSCSQCHTHGQEAKGTMHPMGDLKDIDLHDTCFKCHEDDDCEKCHGADEKLVFSHESTGWPLKGYHAQVNCLSCHADTAKIQKPAGTQCTVCHADGWDAEKFEHSVTGVALDETHKEASCEDCHVEMTKSMKVSCENCHDDKRKYDAAKGFTVVSETPTGQSAGQ